MRARYTFIPLLLLVAAGIPLHAQQSSDSRSASAAALERHGIERGTAGTAISHALFVRLRAGLDGRDLHRRTRELAERSGLRPISTSPLSFFRPLEKHDLQSLLSLAPERRERTLRTAGELERIVELHYEAPIGVDEAARRLAAFPEVEYAEPIPVPALLGELSVPNDPLIPDQTHLARIHALEAWEVWKGDTNTVVGIVDAGVDMFHEDISPNIAANPGEAGLDGQGNDRRTNLIDDDANGVVDDWKGANLVAREDSSTPGNTKGSIHGTPVAGGAAAATNNGIGGAGSGLLCRVFPIKAQPIGGPSLTKGYEGIEYCGKRGFAVVNCSWGDTRYSRTTEAFVAYVIARYDIAVVAAAGNAPEYRPFYPAGFRGVLGVAALDTNDLFVTTWGEHVDVSAPVGVMPIENDQYFSVDPATSFSSPIAAGVLALARSRWPALSAEQAVEHVRRTADSLPVAPGMEFLAGRGRVNALRAVSQDPFSTPAILIDTLWLVDTSGVGKGSFAVGERGRIRLRVRNVLGPATGIRLRVIPYGDGAATVSIDTSWLTLSDLATGGSRLVEPGIAFQQLGADTNRIRLRIEITDAGGYYEVRFEAPFFFRDVPAFLVFATSELALSVSYRGNLGYADYPNNEHGVGVNYDGRDFLFEGGFIAAVSPDSVVSNVRGANQQAQDRDFAIVEPPGAENDSTVTLSDSGAPIARRIGLLLRAKTVVDQQVPNAFAILTHVRNQRSDVIDLLRFGMFCDWDLGGEGDDQLVGYRSSPGERVPFHALLTGAGYAVASGVLASSAPPLFYAINNAVAPIRLYDGFDLSEKWMTVSSGIGETSAGPSDVSVVTGRAVGPLPPGAEGHVTFVVGLGHDSTEATAAMRSLAGTLAGATPRSELVTSLRLDAPRPNPSHSSIRVLVAAPTASRLTLHDLFGREVLDASAALRREQASVTLDVSSLAPGVYFLRLQTGRECIAREILVSERAR